MSVVPTNTDPEVHFSNEGQQVDKQHQDQEGVVLENPLDIFSKLLPLMQQQQLMTLNQLGSTFNASLEKLADKLENRLVNVLSVNSKESHQHGDISPGNPSHTDHTRDDSLGRGRPHGEISPDRSVLTETSAGSFNLYQGTWDDQAKVDRKRKLDQSQKSSCTETLASKKSRGPGHQATDDAVSVIASCRLDDSESVHQVAGQADDTVKQPKLPATLDQQQDLWSDVNIEFEDNEFGPELCPPLASSAKVMYTKKLASEKLKSKMDGVKIPSNCQFMAVKPCNYPIWSRPDQSRQNDIGLQRIQTTMSKSNVHLLQLTEELVESSKLSTNGLVRVDVNKLLQLARNSLVLAGNANQQMNQFRRDSLKIVEGHEVTGQGCS